MPPGDAPAPARGAAAGRRPRLARVHIARKELGLDDATYRAVLLRVTQHDSAAACTDAQIDAVLEEFRRLGWAPKLRRPPLSRKPHVRLIWALWGQLRPQLRDGSPRALRAFVARQTGVADPEWLDGVQAARVTEALKVWLKRGSKAAEGGLSDV